MAEKTFVLDVARPGVRACTAARQHAEPAVHASATAVSRPRNEPETIGILPVGAPASRADDPISTRRPVDEPQAWIKAPAAGATASRRTFRPLVALAALYGLGGMAPLALGVGPHQFAWAAMAVVSATTWATLVWFWSPLRAAMTSARLPILAVLLGVLVVHAMGTLAWSRAAVRVLRDDRFQPDRLPLRLRNPWIAAVLGLVVPGFGLATAGRAVRAGLALWNAGWGIFGAVVLAHAGLLWTWNLRSGVDALPKTFLEGFLVVCAAFVAGGALAWVAAALDGARLAGRRRSARSHRLTRSRGRGDMVAAALVVALVVFWVTFRPAQVAHDLDAFATALRWDGLRLVPLGLESAAAALDPGRPEYAMRVAEVYADMGNQAAARAIQENLRERWETYATMLLQTASATGRTSVTSAPIEPHRDLVARERDLVPSLGGESSATAAQ
jgi:hypothetical protein